jgi:predicted ATP-grasp superfamily ATP-dependent carboligase
MENLVTNKIGAGKHVLILEGYCKQCLPFIRGFKDLGCEVSILCGSRLDCGYASRLPDHKILGICDLKRPEESEEYIVNLIKNGKYDLVFPLFDFSARILSHHKEELSPYAIIYANAPDVFDAANDKLHVMQVCMDNGLPCPQTLTEVSGVDEVRQSGIPFPLIIKPRRMYGARGFHRFETVEEMEAYVRERQLDLSGYVVQECIPEGSRVMGGNLFVDRDGAIRSSYLYICEHLYPEQGGTSTLNALLIREDIENTCRELVRRMHLRGIIGIDLMLDSRDGKGKVIEINVRPVHGIALGYLCGVDHARQVLEDAFGLPVTDMPTKPTDTCLRILQTDVLWFLSSPDRFSRQPRKLGYRKVKEQMFFWDDPLPWFAFLLGGLKDYRKKMLEKTQ